MKVEYKTEKGTVLFLKIENDYSVAGLNDGHIYFWTSSLLQSMGDYPLCVEIPNGNVEYIGLTSEVTELDAMNMLDYQSDNDEHQSPIFKDYMSGQYRLIPLDSFKSLMHHLQVYEVNPFDAIKNVFEKVTYDDFEKLYKEAQERTGKYVVLFKEN